MPDINVPPTLIQDADTIELLRIRLKLEIAIEDIRRQDASRLIHVLTDALESINGILKRAKVDS